MNDAPRPATPAPPAWPPGEGEMAERIRAHDWAATPLGPSEAWPQSLRVATRLLVTSRHPMFIWWGPELIQLYNDAYCETMGPEKHPDALGHAGQETWAEIWDTIGPQIRQVLAGGPATWHEDQLVPVTRHGARQNVWWTYSFSPIDEEGAPNGIGAVLVICRDVTAEHLAREAVAESEARHRLLIEGWAQAVWETDANGAVVADSPSWRAYTGQTLEEWLGYGWLDAIHPDDRDYAERQWREAVAARKVVDAEFRLRAPGGGWRWTNVRAAPVLDARGQVEKWVGMNIDIGVRKRAEAALRESEEQYRRLFETMTEGFTIMEAVRDDAGRVVDAIFLQANQAWERQAGVAFVPGTKVSEFFPGSTNPDWIETWSHVADTGAAHREEQYVASTDCWYQTHYWRVGEAGSNLIAAVFDDVTARKRAEAARREGQERQAFLLKLSDALRAESSADAVAERAIRMLSQQMQLDRCYITFYRPEDDRADFPYQVGNDKVAPLPDAVRLSDFPDAYRQVLGKTVVVEDDLARQGLSDAERRNSGALGMRALLASTIRKGENNPLSSMVAVSGHPRRWTPGEIALVEDVAERTWAAMERARAEAALRASEELRRIALEGGRLGTWRWDLRAQLIWGDAAFLALWGFPPSDEARRLPDFTNRMSPQGEAEMGGLITRAIAAGEEFDGQLEVVSGPTRGRWVQWRGRAERDKPWVVNGVSFDVTGQRLAEQRLRESEGRFRGFAENSADVLWIANATGTRLEYGLRG